MRKLVVILVVALTGPSGAKVWVTPYRCDETTPLATVDANQPTVYEDIMVGTRLAIIITSDAPGLYYIGEAFRDWKLWAGSLLVPRGDSERGRLSGRGYNKQTSSYEDSVLPAAGNPSFAKVRYRERAVGFSFDLNVQAQSVAGDWFIFDYHAERVGTCAVQLDQITNVAVPTQTLLFRHIPSRDFNGDTVVDLRDFALLASNWNAAVSADPNSPARALDLNGDTRVDFDDLALFSEYWLERTDCGKFTSQPNQSPRL